MIQILKQTLTEIFYLFQHHWKKLMELSSVFIIASAVISIIISYSIALTGDFFQSNQNSDTPLLIDIYSHTLNISTNIFILNTAIFSVFLLKYKHKLNLVSVKHIFQLTDSKLYSSWFIGIIIISISELILYNDLIFLDNYHFYGTIGPTNYSDSIKLHSWINTFTNLLQRQLPIVIAVFIISSVLISDFKLLKSAKLIRPLFVSIFLMYCSSIFYYSFNQDIHTHIFTLIAIPFETPWVYYAITIVFSLFLLSFYFTFIATSIAFPVSTYYNVNLKHKAENTPPPEDEIIDSEMN